MEAQQQAPLIRMRDISVSFSGIPVVDQVSLDIHSGEILCLAGENGAGKSTLMRVLSGVHPADAGDIAIDDDATDIQTVQDARRHGIAIIHQELALAPNLTVAENLAMGQEPRRWFGIDRKRLHQKAEEALATVGANFNTRQETGSLSVGQQQLVEIARALNENPRVLILDEPTAALSNAEERRLLTILKRLREQGLSILYITHRMKEIQELADRVCVMRDGQVVHTLPIDEAPNERIVELMVGRAPESLFGNVRRKAGESVLHVEALTGAGVEHFSINLPAGQITGLAGLVGAGRTEAARLLSGASEVNTGTISLQDQPFSPRSPRFAMKQGVVMLPESRKEQGLFLNRSVRENICAATLSDLSRAGVLNNRRMQEAAHHYVDLLQIKCRDINQPVRELSGGNQQKVLLARCLSNKPRVLILDEPTRGVDVGAKVDIYRAIEACAGEGAAVLLISSELPEMLGLADRVFVMREGSVVGALPNDGLTEEEVMRYAAGLAADNTSSSLLPTRLVDDAAPSHDSGLSSSAPAPTFDLTKDG